MVRQLLPKFSVLPQKNLEYTDEQLIDLVKKGDENAFSTLYNRYWDKLYTVSYYRLSDELEAEEVVQDLFLSIWSRKEQLEIKSSVAAYLSVSVKYLIINKLAKRKRQASFRKTFLKTMVVSEETTDLWLMGKELSERLEAYINELPEKCRIVFKMSREEGKSAKEISKELSLAEKTIEAHITKALRILKSNLPTIVAIFLYVMTRK